MCIYSIVPMFLLTGVAVVHCQALAALLCHGMGTSSVCSPPPSLVQVGHAIQLLNAIFFNNSVSFGALPYGGYFEGVCGFR